MPGCWPVGLGSERRAVRASLSGREPATGISLVRDVTLLLWAHGVGVHADAPAHSFPTNADARGEAVRTMPRTLACYPRVLDVATRRLFPPLVVYNLFHQSVCAAVQTAGPPR